MDHRSFQDKIRSLELDFAPFPNPPFNAIAISFCNPEYFGFAQRDECVIF